MWPRSRRFNPKIAFFESFMLVSLVCLSRVGLLFLGGLYLAPSAAPPVSVSVRIVSGPWGGQEYTIAHSTLTVLEIPPIRAANRTTQSVFKAALPADAASRHLRALDPATYEGLPNEMLDGGSVLVVELQQGDAKQCVRYQHGQYTRLDLVTAFLLTYINQHVPAKWAIAADWLKPAAGSSKRANH